MIVELQAERQRLDEAIEALERLSTSNLRRRGRPPRWLKDLDGSADGVTPGLTPKEPPDRKKPS